jgi:hypothetical protein
MILNHLCLVTLRWIHENIATWSSNLWNLHSVDVLRINTQPIYTSGNIFRKEPLVFFENIPAFWVTWQQLKFEYFIGAFQTN